MGLKRRTVPTQRDIRCQSLARSQLRPGWEAPTPSEVTHTGSDRDDRGSSENRSVGRVESKEPCSGLRPQIGSHTVDSRTLGWGCFEPANLFAGEVVGSRVEQSTHGNVGVHFS